MSFAELTLFAGGVRNPATQPRACSVLDPAANPARQCSALASALGLSQKLAKISKISKIAKSLQRPSEPYEPDLPIASLMEPGFDGIATVMEPPDRQGHGATCRMG